MNTKRYNSLPVDIRKVIDDLSGDYLVDLFAKAQYDINEEGEKFAVEKCHFQYVDLLPGQMARWEEALKPLWDQAATSLDARGLPGKKILDELQTLLVKYNQ
jgi:TRAP-type C4-dicarboxylate transport system substrate-binding protein